jgi:hypothetical protein
MRAMRAWLGFLIAALGGCAYTSEYRAPVDGRPRAVWKDDHVVVERAGAPMDYGCMQSLAGVSGSDRLRLVEGDLKVQPVEPPRAHVDVGVGVAVSAAFFVPHYWGPPLMSPAPGMLPLFPAPPLLLPPPVMLVPRPPPLAVAPPVALASGGGIGSHNDGSQAMVALGVLAVVVLPVVAVVLAATPPEGGAKNAQAIDQVNAYNDWLRVPGWPCSYAAPGGGAS